MLTKRSGSKNRARRVVLVGAGGFVGSAAFKSLKKRGHDAIAVVRSDIDLRRAEAASFLSELLKPHDVLVVAAARAPVKSNSMLLENLSIQSTICEAIELSKLAQVIYISSDAVYADSFAPLNEESCAEPPTLHGVMHLSREVMLRQVCVDNLCVLRPTLIYGPADPHNGYGPNRFARSAATDGAISLFGGGEEVRDHVFVEDVATLVAEVVESDAVGTLNVATGKAESFERIAELIAVATPRPVLIKRLPRTGPIPHGGRREFDAAAVQETFPTFSFIPLEDGLRELCS